MERLTSGLTAIALLFAAATLPAQSQPIEVILTGNLHVIVPPVTDDPVVDSAPARLEEELRRLREEEPRRFLIDAGRSHSLGFAHESGYGFPSTPFLRRNQFDLVNLDARDAFVSHANARGYNFVPLEFAPRLASNITSHFMSTPLPVDARAVRSDQPSVTIVSFHDPAANRGLGLSNRVLTTLDDEIVGRAIANGRNREDYVILFSAMPQERLLALIDDERRRPHLIVATGGMIYDLPKLMPPVMVAPQTGEAHLLRLEPNGAVTTLDVISVLDSAELSSLFRAPVALLGMPIPNINTVLEQFLGVTNATIAEDRFQQEEFAGNTRVERPVVYRVARPDGTNLRLYRMNNLMAWYRHPGFFMPAYPELNLIFAVTEDHQFYQIIARHKAPILGENTLIVDGINTQSGVDPADWDIDLDFYAGGEEVLEWLRQEIARTLEVDRLLYGSSE